MFVKIENNIVVQKQPYEQDGFVEVGNSICCGMVHDGSDMFDDANFSFPEKVYSWGKVRSLRNSLLYQSDYTQLIDCALPSELKALWAEYRQTLRDITELASPNEAMQVLQSLEKPQ